MITSVLMAGLVTASAPRPQVLLVLGQGKVTHGESVISEWILGETVLDIRRYQPLSASAAECQSDDLDCFERLALSFEAEILLVLDETTAPTYLLTTRRLDTQATSILQTNDLEGALRASIPDSYYHPAQIRVKAPIGKVASMNNEACIVPCAFERLAPGEYSVKVGRQQRQLLVGPDENLELEFEDTSTSLWSSPWLWTGIGAVIVGAAITSGIILSQPTTATVRAK